MVVVAVMLAMLAAPALAEHDAEHVQQTVAGLMERVLPPGYGSALGIETYDYGLVPLYGLAALCYNEGGYWYWGGDGYYYWHSC